MFNFGFTELIALGAIALIFIGPKQLPELARTIARLLNELKRASKDFTATLSEVKDETKKVVDDLKVDLVDQKEFEKNLLSILDEKVGPAPHTKPIGDVQKNSKKTQKKEDESVSISHQDDHEPHNEDDEGGAS